MTSFVTKTRNNSAPTSSRDQASKAMARCSLRWCSGSSTRTKRLSPVSTVNCRAAYFYKSYVSHAMSAALKKWSRTYSGKSGAKLPVSIPSVARPWLGCAVSHVLAPLMRFARWATTRCVGQSAWTAMAWWSLAAATTTRTVAWVRHRRRHCLSWRWLRSIRCAANLWQWPSCVVIRRVKLPNKPGCPWAASSQISVAH